MSMTAATGRPILRGGALYPGAGIGLLAGIGPYVYDATSARRIPAVGRAIGLYAGLVKQCPMLAYRGTDRVDPTPSILLRPDVTKGRYVSWFVQVSVEDYLLNGNAVCVITARRPDGWPAAAYWLPAAGVYVTWNYKTPAVPATYSYMGEVLPTENVVHVMRGVDRNYPVRGVGVVEEFMNTLDRVAMEEEYERGALANGAVPSAAIITPQATLTKEVADEAKESWMEKFAGPVREPVILPNGTVVQPLAWSPTDTQLVEARRLSLIDVANMFNLDGYWLGAPVAGMTYRTAGPQYQQILRTSLEPVLCDFEDAWSWEWLPRGQRLRFERSQLLRDDLLTSMQAAQLGYSAGILDLPEARVLVGVPPDAPGALGVGADQAGAASPDDPNANLPEGEVGGGDQ
jgi:HK97 family phage portal protein